MSYIPLGSRGPLVAAADTTGLNQGNLTCSFDIAALNVRESFFEVYSMSVTGLAQVATVTVYVNNKVRSTAKLLGNSEWDPQQPIILTFGDELALCWDFTSASPPSATIWLRYDPAISQQAG